MSLCDPDPSLILTRGGVEAGRQRQPASTPPLVRIIAAVLVRSPTGGSQVTWKRSIRSLRRKSVSLFDSLYYSGAARTGRKFLIFLDLLCYCSQIRILDYLAEPVRIIF